MVYVFTILLSILLIVWRITYINGLANDWNEELGHYIYRLATNPAIEPNTIEYMEKQKIKGWKYYLRMDVWEIKDIINDPFLVQEIHSQIQNKYKS